MSAPLPDTDRSAVHVPLKWLLASVSLLCTGLLVAIVAMLQASSQSSLNAITMILAVVSFGAQLLLASVGYLASLRQEERSSVIHKETLESIQTLRIAIDANLSVTSTMSDRFNAEFQTMLDHVLTASARLAREPHEAKLLETLGSDLREKALEMAISAPDSPRSRLASAVVKLLHESASTVANSVSYSKGIISWLRNPNSERCWAVVSGDLATIEEVRQLARRVAMHEEASSACNSGGRYVIFPAKPQTAVVEAGKVSQVIVTWLDQFAAEVV